MSAYATVDDMQGKDPSTVLRELAWTRRQRADLIAARDAHAKARGEAEHRRSKAERALADAKRSFRGALDALHLARTITTVEEIRELPALTVVLYDDMANGGPLQTYVVPDDGTVMFKDSGEFHLMTFAGDYIDAKDMPLPLTVVYEVGA
jgi:hypothetical protein